MSGKLGSAAERELRRARREHERVFNSVGCRGQALQAGQPQGRQGSGRTFYGDPLARLQVHRQLNEPRRAPAHDAKWTSE